MRIIFRGAAFLVAGWLAGFSPAQAQDLAPGEPNLPLPLYHSRPDTGGFFITGNYSMYRQTNPIRSQPVAFRGFYVIDGTNLGPQSIGTSSTGLPTLNTSNLPNGSFLGSGTVALDAESVAGPNTYMPGFRIDAGWKFQDESSLTFSYLYLAKANMFSTASLIPQNLQVGANDADSFISSPVYGYPTQYGGPQNDVFAFADPTLSNQVTAGGGTIPTVTIPTVNDPNNPNPPTATLPGFATPSAGYGVFNAADFMTLEFTQRSQMFEITYRKPVYETDNYRLSGIVGPRFFWIWERFKWSTTDLNVFGSGAAEDAAVYTNIVSNRMYGVHGGFGQEWYLGRGFGATLDLQAALFMNVVKERAKFELQPRYSIPQSKRNRTVFTIVPEIQPTVGLAWYPRGRNRNAVEL